MKRAASTEKNWPVGVSTWRQKGQPSDCAWGVNNQKHTRVVTRTAHADGTRAATSLFLAVPLRGAVGVQDVAAALARPHVFVVADSLEAYRALPRRTCHEPRLNCRRRNFDVRHGPSRFVAGSSSCAAVRACGKGQVLTCGVPRRGVGGPRRNGAEWVAGHKWALVRRWSARCGRRRRPAASTRSSSSMASTASHPTSPRSPPSQRAAIRERRSTPHSRLACSATGSSRRGGGSRMSSSSFAPRSPQAHHRFSPSSATPMVASWLGTPSASSRHAARSATAWRPRGCRRTRSSR